MIKDSIILYKPKEGVIFEIFDGEMILLNPSDGNYFSTDGLGVIIWEQILHSGDTNSITSHICQLFHDKVDRNYVKETVHEFIEDLVKADLLEILPKAIEFDAAPGSPTKCLDHEGELKTFRKPTLLTYRELQEKFAHPAGIKRSDE